METNPEHLHWERALVQWAAGDARLLLQLLLLPTTMNGRGEALTFESLPNDRELRHRIVRAPLARTDWAAGNLAKLWTHVDRGTKPTLSELEIGAARAFLFDLIRGEFRGSRIRHQELHAAPPGAAALSRTSTRPNYGYPQCLTSSCRSRRLSRWGLSMSHYAKLLDVRRRQLGGIEFIPSCSPKTPRFGRLSSGSASRAGYSATELPGLTSEVQSTRRAMPRSSSRYFGTPRTSSS